MQDPCSCHRSCRGNHWRKFGDVLEVAVGEAWDAGCGRRSRADRRGAAPVRDEVGVCRRAGRGYSPPSRMTWFQRPATLVLDRDVGRGDPTAGHGREGQAVVVRIGEGGSRERAGTEVDLLRGVAREDAPGDHGTCEEHQGGRDRQFWPIRTRSNLWVARIDSPCPGHPSGLRTSVTGTVRKYSVAGDCGRAGSVSSGQNPPRCIRAPFVLSRGGSASWDRRR